MVDSKEQTSRQIREQWLLRMERWTEAPLTVLAAVLAAILIVPHVTSLSAARQEWLAMIDNLIWGAFAADLAIKVAISPDRLRYLRTHWFDVLLVVLPMLRMLRIARSLRAVHLVEILRASAAASRIVVLLGRIIGRRGMHYVLLSALIVVVLAGSLITIVERGSASSNIQSLPDGLWWAMTTVTTVGYGDAYPTTAIGRGIGVALMLLGITLFGVLTAHLAAVFVEDSDDLVAARISELAAKIDALEATLRRQAGSSGRKDA